MVADRNVPYITSLYFHWFLQAKNGRVLFACSCDLPACTCDFLPQVVRVYMRSLSRVYMRPPDRCEGSLSLSPPLWSASAIFSHWAALTGLIAMDERWICDGATYRPGHLAGWAGNVPRSSFGFVPVGDGWPLVSPGPVSWAKHLEGVSQPVAQQWCLCCPAWFRHYLSGRHPLHRTKSCCGIDPKQCKRRMDMLRGGMGDLKSLVEVL